MDEIAALIEPEIPGLRRYARALVRDREAADDLVQDTLERAIAHWRSRRSEGDLRAWLFAIGRNLHLSALRQAGRRPVCAGPDALDRVVAHGATPDGALGARDVLVALDRLPEEHRSVLLLVGVEDMSYAQAARVLDVPIGTVMSRLSRARDRLRQEMDGERPAILRRVK